jgi:hypothetical protein
MRQLHSLPLRHSGCHPFPQRCSRRLQILPPHSRLRPMTRRPLCLARRDLLQWSSMHLPLAFQRLQQFHFRPPRPLRQKSVMYSTHRCDTRSLRCR